MADSAGSAKPHRKSRWLKLGLLLTPFIILMLFLLALESSGRKRLGLAVEAARRDGRPLRFDEIVARRKKWAANEDGGLAFEKMQAGLTEVLREDEFKQAPLFEKESPPLGHRWTLEDAQAAGAALAKASGSLAELERIGTMPGGGLPFVADENPMSTLLPSLSPLRSAAKLVALRAESHAMKGDTASLTADVGLMLRLASLLSDHPTLISSLVEIAIEQLSVSTVQRICALATPAPDALLRIEAMFAAQEEIDPLYWGLLGERASFLGTAEWMLRTGTSLPEMPDVLRLPGISGWLRRDMSVGMRFHNRLISVLDKPRQRAAVAKQIEQELPKLPTYYFYTRMLMPAISGALDLGLARNGALRAARVALAAERYRQARGDFPDRLTDLVPEYVKELPADPFNERPLLYKRTAEGIVVYSVGINGKDDGGDVLPAKSRKSADTGFKLLRPELRGLPPIVETQPTESSPAEP